MLNTSEKNNQAQDWAAEPHGNGETRCRQNMDQIL